MKRVQLYLPPDLYDGIKLEAKKKKMSFASYVRLQLTSSGVGKKQSEKTLYERFPILKMAGTFSWGGSITNEEIDEALYGGRYPL